MKEQLHEISQKSQAESIDLWPEIYAELKDTKMRNYPRINYSLMRLAAVFSLFFLGALVVYAVSQIYVDSGLEGERAERLVTQVNQSITHGDITIRWDWVYLDINRVSLGYTVLDENGDVFRPESANFFISSDLYMREPEALSDGEYRSYYPIVNRDRVAYNINLEQQIHSEVFFNEYYNMVWDEIGDVVELDFRIYWKGQLYRFIAEAPVYPSQFEIENSVMLPESHNMTLRELIITPTMTNIMFCYQIPEEMERSGLRYEGYWEATDFNLYFDDVKVADLFPDADVEMFGGYHMQHEQCSLLYWAIPNDVLPQRVRFEVNGLRENRNGLYSLEQAEFLMQAYAEQGVTADMYGPFEGTYSVWAENIYESADIEAREIYNEVMSDFYAAFPDLQRIDGKWEIEFELHEPVN